MADASVELKVNRVLLNAADAPTLVHRLMWTRVNDTIVLELGYFDLPELRHVLDTTKELKDAGKPASEMPAVNLFITHRLAASPSMILQLKEDIDLLVDDLRKNAIVSPEGEKH